MENRGRIPIATVLLATVFAVPAFAAAFTPDGQFGTGANATEGREAPRKMIADFCQPNTENESKTGAKRPASTKGLKLGLRRAASRR